MIDIVPRLDKTQVFCDLDDCLGARSHAGETPAGSHRFYQDFEANYAKRLKLSTDDKRKPCQSKLCRVRSNDDSKSQLKVHKSKLYPLFKKQRSNN